MCFLGGLMLNVECQVSPFVYGTAPREPRHGFAIWLPSVGCGPVKKEGIQWLSWKTPWIEPRKMLRFLGDIIWYKGYINLARYIVYTVWVFSSNADLIGALFIREDDPKKNDGFFRFLQMAWNHPEGDLIGYNQHGVSYPANMEGETSRWKTLQFCHQFNLQKRKNPMCFFSIAEFDRHSDKYGQSK